jgi:hypothetical protein
MFETHPAKYQQASHQFENAFEMGKRGRQLGRGVLR